MFKKKFLKTILMTTLAFSLSFPLTSFASTNSSMIGVSITEPVEEQLTKGTAKPTSSWNVNTKGDYTLSGKASNSTLYTNYYITGATKYRVFVTNKHERSSLTFKVYNSKNSLIALESKKISAGASGYIDVSVDSTSSKIFVSFSAPSNFSGYVRKR